MSQADRRRTESVGRRASAGASPRPEADASVGPRRAQRAALIVSKWAGHYDSAFTQKTYVHASNEDLQQAGPHSPGFTRSLSAVRNCETAGPAAAARALAGRWKYDPDLRIRWRRARRDSNPQPSDP